LLGRFDADHAIRPPSWAEDVLAARLATLVETVEPQEYETLLARGANLTAEDAVACLHTLIDQAVEETDGERRSAG
jgi:hypothetical protein